MQKLLCNVQKFRRNTIQNVWLAMSKKWKSSVGFMVFHPKDKIPLILQLHQGENIKWWQLLHKKALFVKPIFTYGTLDPFDVIITSLYDFSRKHMCFPLAHSRRVHIPDHNTERNVALDQCSCSKTSGMVFCVSKGHEPLGGSLIYQVLKMNTVHPQARVEF